MEYNIGYLVAGMLGASIGSFITMLVYRLHENKPISLERSQCIYCKKKLGVLELIPLMSFLFLKGKCKQCKKRIPIQYFLIEFVTTALYLYAWYRYSISPDHSIVFLIRDWVVIGIAVFTFVYDYLYHEVSSWITIGGGISVALLYIVSTPENWASIAWGVAVGVGWFGIQFAVSKGKWIGGGDIMIGFFMGSLLGLGKTIVALGVAYVIGACIGIALLAVGKKDRKDQIAFGTFLMIGTLISLWFGGDVVSWYYSLLS